MKTLITTFIDEAERSYTGRELKPHWIYRTFGIAGDAIVVFQGPCDVPTERLVDLKDVAQQSYIVSDQMLHFIAEWFDSDLERAVLRQRLFIVTLKEALESLSGDLYLHRRGDDLYDGEGKLSVSIAAPTPASTLMHTGINISCTEAPVPVACLSDYGLDPVEVARVTLARFEEELSSLELARCTVKPVV